MVSCKVAPTTGTFTALLVASSHDCDIARQASAHTLCLTDYTNWTINVNLCECSGYLCNISYTHRSATLPKPLTLKKIRLGVDSLKSSQSLHICNTIEYTTSPLVFHRFAKNQSWVPLRTTGGRLALCCISFCFWIRALVAMTGLELAVSMQLGDISELHSDIFGNPL